MKFLFSGLWIFLFSLSTQAGQWEAKNFQNVSYEIYVPQKKLNSKRSLMLTLHGCAQKAKDFALHGNWEPAADQYSTVVVAPQVPNGGAIMGCWNYYGPDQTAQNKDNVVLIQILKEILNDKNLDIDPRRVYVSGLSSGGGEALLLGCLRPDLIAGMGLNSSPVVPSEAQDISRPQITADQMALFCQKISGSHSTGFDTQMTSVIVADHDPTVSNEHSKLIVAGMRSILGLNKEIKFDLSKLEGPNKAGSGTLYSKSNGKPQISFIINDGLGHNWAAGGGQPGGAFITQNSINYPLYLLSFFESSNPRVFHPK